MALITYLRFSKYFNATKNSSCCLINPHHQGQVQNQVYLSNTKIPQINNLKIIARRKPAAKGIQGLAATAPDGKEK